MRVLVIAPLRAGADFASDDPWKAPVRFEHATFDAAMEKVAPSLVVDGADKKQFEVRFPSLRAFERDAAATPDAGSLVDDILSGMGSEPTASGPLAHPEVRALERAWRGLAFLVARSGDAVVEAIAAAHDDVEAALEKVARAGGAPIDLVVVDHTIDTTARDLERLVRWAELGEGLGAPIVCGGTPALLGENDLASLARSQRRLRSSDDPRAVRFRSATAKDPMRWVAVALNDDAVARAPYLVGALALDAYTRTGWAAAFPRSRVTGVALEAAASEDAALEAAAAGVILLVGDGSEARVAGAPVAYRAASTGGGTSPAATLGLGDQLFLGRISQLVIELASAIPSDTPEKVARETALGALADLFAETPGKKPSFDVVIRGAPPVLEVTVHPRGFAGIALEEATLGASLG